MLCVVTRCVRMGMEVGRSPVAPEPPARRSEAPALRVPISEYRVASASYTSASPPHLAFVLILTSHHNAFSARRTTSEQNTTNGSTRRDAIRRDVISAL